MHGFDGIPHNVTTLEECLNACTDMEDTCVAVDWEPSNAEHSCWILTTTTTEDSTETGVITHYIPNRPTPSESRTLVSDSHCLLLTLYSYCDKTPWKFMNHKMFSVLQQFLGRIAVLCT